MDYPFRPVSASAVSRILALADFKRARPGNTWSNGYQVTGLGNLVEVSYMATRGEDGLAVLTAMVEAINAKDGYVAWLGKPDWMADLLDNSSPSVMVRKTIPNVAPAARELEANKAKLAETEASAAKVAAQQAQREAIEASLAEKKAEEPQEPVQERPKHHSVRDTQVVVERVRVVRTYAYAALREHLDRTGLFFTAVEFANDDEGDPGLLRVLHLHGSNVLRDTYVGYDEMTGTFWTPLTHERFAEPKSLVDHLKLFLVGE